MAHLKIKHLLFTLFHSLSQLYINNPYNNEEKSSGMGKINIATNSMSQIGMKLLILCDET